jgi:hypothetical protein
VTVRIRLCMFVSQTAMAKCKLTNLQDAVAVKVH